MINVNTLLKNMIMDFEVKSYSIKNNQGIVIKFNKNGVNMEVEYEAKENTARD